MCVYLCGLESDPSAVPVTCLRVVVSPIIDKHLVEAYDSNLARERLDVQTSGERYPLTWHIHTQGYNN